jgi:hypothetical protein
MTCRVVVAGTGYWAATLPTFTDGARAQAVLEASLMGHERWVEVDYLLAEMAISKKQGKRELSVLRRRSSRASRLTH